MTDTAQDRAVKNYRKRLQQRGLARFEVLGLAADRKLIRSLAKRLAEDGPESTRLRATVRQTLTEEAPRRGGIYAALWAHQSGGFLAAIADRPSSIVQGADDL